MLESRIFGPDEDSSRDSGKKNRTYAASLTVRARWGRIRFRDASQEAQYQRHHYRHCRGCDHRAGRRP